MSYIELPSGVAFMRGSTVYCNGTSKTLQMHSVTQDYTKYPKLIFGTACLGGTSCLGK